MRSRLRVAVLLLAMVTLVGVATPPVIEDHLEVGFCSADCPVQHAGHGAAITPALASRATLRALVVATAVARAAGGDLGTVASPDAPRAPPPA